MAVSNYNDDISKDFNDLNKDMIFINKCNFKNNLLYKNNIFISGERKLVYLKLNANLRFFKMYINYYILF